MNDDVRRLEEKIAYLERHVTEQDKAMLEFAEEIAALRREVRALRARGAGREDDAADQPPTDDRPPHY